MTDHEFETRWVTVTKARRGNLTALADAGAVPIIDPSRLHASDDALMATPLEPVGPQRGELKPTRPASRNVLHEAFRPQTILTLQQTLRRFNEQIDIATAWIGAIPALPNNEVRQVVAHVLQMSLAFIDDQSPEAIAVEQIRAQKHLALATFDCVSVLNRFHFAALQQLIRVSQERNATLSQYMLTELDRLSALQAAIPDPSGQHWSNLPAREKADKDRIEDLTLAQQQIAQDLEAMYRVFESHFGSQLLKETFTAVQEGSSSTTGTGKITPSEAELFLFRRINSLLETAKRSSQEFSSELDKFEVTINGFKDWARETRMRI